MENKEKIENISPDTHYIITKKTYNKLIWYLISIINPNDKNAVKNSGYENYKWVTELSIPKSQLNKYNKFEDDEAKINVLNTYIQSMHEKLEKKDLIRVVRTPNGEVLIDESGKLNGRGAYLKKDIDVINKAEKNKILNKHLEIEVNKEIFEELKQLIEK